MTSPRRLEPIILQINVEELVDGDWGQDRSLLPALSSNGVSPMPESGRQFEAYRRAYEHFVRRFAETANRLAEDRRPGQTVLVEAGDVLRPWYQGPSSSFDEALFEEALEETPMPTRDEIEGF